MYEVMVMDSPVYKRVLLKISGEALAGEKHSGLDFGVIGSVCEAVKKCVDMGVEVGVVIGGGNFWRGGDRGGRHSPRQEHRRRLFRGPEAGFPRRQIRRHQLRRGPGPAPGRHGFDGDEPVHG